MKSLRTHESLATTRKSNPFSRATPAKVVSIRFNNCAIGKSLNFGASAPASSLEMSSSALKSSFMADSRFDTGDDTLAIFGSGAAAELRDEQTECVERLSQVVTCRRQKPRLGLVRDFQLARPLLDLAFERRIGLLQLHRHAVELIAQGFKFVSGLDDNAFGQIAVADLRRTFAQRSDRHHHSAGQEKASEKCNGQRSQQENSRTDQRLVERRIGLFDR